MARSQTIFWLLALFLRNLEQGAFLINFELQTPTLKSRVSSRSKLKQHVLIKVVPFGIEMNISFVKIISFSFLCDFLSFKDLQLAGPSANCAWSC